MKLAFCILFFLECASAQFNESAKEEILKMHNDLRSGIAKGSFSGFGLLLPAAANMRKMKWNESLADEAQRVANDCPKSSTGTPGENIFREGTNTPETAITKGATASEKWVKKLKLFGRGFFRIQIDEGILDSQIASAIQMAWAETEFVGCGVKDCGRDPVFKDSTIVVVCLYKEKGNILNSNVYKKGVACSSCPSGHKCEGDSGLCVF